MIFWTFARPARLPDPEEYLSDGERQRLAGLRFEKRRQEWLLGRWAAKRLVQASGWHSSPLVAMAIENEASGAPRMILEPARAHLAAGVPLPGCISISHRAGAAFCALSAAPVGADLEWIEPRSAAFVQDFLHPTEIQAAAACENDTSRAVWVNRCWSAKEALLKALRVGLREDTRQIELSSVATASLDGWAALEINANLTALAGQPFQAWQRIEAGFVLSLALLGAGEGSFRRIDVGS